MSVGPPRLLRLLGTRLAVVSDAILAITPHDPDMPARSLCDLFGDAGERFADAGSAEPHRVLVASGGARIEVPAAMQLFEPSALVRLPPLLEPYGARLGLIGVVLDEPLALVWDPRLPVTEVGS